MKKEELTKINVRIVNMRSASFAKITKELKKRKSKIFNLSFCDEEENVSLPETGIWTTKSLMSTYRKLEPQAAKFCQSSVRCPVRAYRKSKSRSGIICPVDACHEQSAKIFIFITDYWVEKGNYGGCCDDKETYFYLSLYGITDYLRDENIRLSNFVQIAIYRDVLRHLCGERIAHDRVKWCIFDTNSEERLPLITESCAKPAICRECRDKIEKLLKENGKPIAYLTETEEALRKLKKGLYYWVKDYINNHPWRALLITIGSMTILPIVINLLSSYIYDYLTK